MLPWVCVRLDIKREPTQRQQATDAACKSCLRLCVYVYIYIYIYIYIHVCRLSTACIYAHSPTSQLFIKEYTRMQTAFIH